LEILILKYDSLDLHVCLFIYSMVAPREPGLERESVSWFSKLYPRTQHPSWRGPRPVDIIQVIPELYSGLFKYS